MMKLKLAVVHRDLHKYGDRNAVIDALLRYANVERRNELTEPSVFNQLPDCMLVHDSQDDDVTIAKKYCSNPINNCRLILFGGTVSIPSTFGNYGCRVPETVFVANAVYFFSEWARLGAFPAFDFIIGEPELEYALEVLHRLLPGVYGEPLNEPQAEWRVLENLKNRCGEADDRGELGSLWNLAQEKYVRYLQRNPSEDPILLLTDLRDTLLGEGESGSEGLVAFLSRLRKSRT